MPANRFFAQDTRIEGEEFIHLKKVMRKSSGDHIEVVDGKGHLKEARIVEIERHHAELTIIKTTLHPLPSPKTYLAQPLLKQANLELVIEKGTELGIDAFYFWDGDLSPQKQTRLHHIATAALKQSGRFYLPTIHLYPALTDIPFDNHPIIYANFGGTAPTFPKEDHFLVVGRESGFTPKELQFLESKGSPISLSVNTLRAETAALTITALSKTQYLSQH